MDLTKSSRINLVVSSQTLALVSHLSWWWCFYHFTCLCTSGSPDTVIHIPQLFPSLEHLCKYHMGTLKFTGVGDIKSYFSVTLKEGCQV